MTTFPRPLSTLAIVSLVLLRITVGWHFFREGISKFLDPAFSSAPLLQQSTGPLARLYQSFIPDPYELERLDEQRIRESWTGFLAALETAADESSKAKIESIWGKWDLRLADYFRALGADLIEYRAHVAAHQEAARDRLRQTQQFERENLQRNRTKLNQMRAPWLADLRSMDRLFREELAGAVGGAAERTPASLFAHRLTWVDNTVKWTVLLIGIFLLVGLLVPLSSVAGIGFLLSVWLSQPFWVPDAVLEYSHYQAVEMAALFVLAATSAGRFAGLDFFWHARKEQHHE